MGAHALLFWAAADGAGTRGAEDALSAAITGLGGSPSFRWSARVATYGTIKAQNRAVEEVALAGPTQPVPGFSRELATVTFDDNPAALYMVVRWEQLPAFFFYVSFIFISL
jgi:hypothetical protein